MKQATVIVNPGQGEQTMFRHKVTEMGGKVTGRGMLTVQIAVERERELRQWIDEHLPDWQHDES